MPVVLFKVVSGPVGLFIVFWGVVARRSVGRNKHFVGTYFFLILLWKWRQNVRPKRRYPPNVVWRHNAEGRDKNLDLWEKHHILWVHGASWWSGNILHLYPVCLGRFWAGNRLSWLRILCFSSVAPDQYRDSTLISHDHFLPNLFQCAVH
jgi:hypothetical protein